MVNILMPQSQTINMLILIFSFLKITLMAQALAARVAARRKTLAIVYSFAIPFTRWVSEMVKVKFG